MGARASSPRLCPLHEAGSAQLPRRQRLQPMELGLSCHYDSQDQVDTLTFQSQSLRDRARRFEEALRKSTEEQLEVGSPARGMGGVAHQAALLNFSPGAHVASSAGSPKTGPLC